MMTKDLLLRNRSGAGQYGLSCLGTPAHRAFESTCSSCLRPMLESRGLYGCPVRPLGRIKAAKALTLKKASLKLVCLTSLANAKFPRLSWTFTRSGFSSSYSSPATAS